LNWISLQILPDKADSERMKRDARARGITPTPASYAEREVLFTGTDGIVIAAGKIMQAADGTEFAVDADGTIAGGTVTVAVTCKSAGTIGNVATGTKLTLISPIAGVNSEGTVQATGISDGSEEESAESLLSRYLLELQDPPEGGSDADYKKWARQVSGVTRVWVYRHWMGGGTVGVALRPR
jgi:uncharacterized phage protein gp47/JayE